MRLAGIAALVLVAASLAPGARTAPPDDPLLNPSFEVGSPLSVDTGPASDIVEETGGVASGTAEWHAWVSAPPWTFRALSGSDSPASETHWRPGWGLPVGPTRAALEIDYDYRDRQSKVPILTQFIGQRPYLALWSIPAEASAYLEVIEGAGLAVWAGAYMPGEVVPCLAPPVAVTPETAPLAWFSWQFPCQGNMTQFFLAFVPFGPESDGTRLLVDNVALHGARISPEARPPRLLP